MIAHVEHFGGKRRKKEKKRKRKKLKIFLLWQTYLLTELATCWCHRGTGPCRREIVHPIRSWGVHPVGKRLALAALLMLEMSTVSLKIFFF